MRGRRKIVGKCKETEDRREEKKDEQAVKTE